MDEQLERMFTYHPATEETQGRYRTIRANIKDLAYLMKSLCPASRELSLAITHLEQASMWANASIARTPAENLPPLNTTALEAPQSDSSENRPEEPVATAQ